MRENYVFRGEKLTEKDVWGFLNRHRCEADIARDFDYYLGRARPYKGRIPEGRPDNRANTNLAKYICDTATGYFVGIPPKYKYTDRALEQALTEIFDRCDEGQIDYEIAENMSICGTGYDLVYIGEEGNIAIAALDPRQCFVIRGPEIGSEPIAGVRYWSENGRTRGEVYLPGETRRFREEGSGIVYTDSAATPFGAVNMTEYPNNRFLAGDFEQAIDNIDAYNLTLSYVTDDLQSIANAYLVLSGMEKPDEEALDVLRNERVIGLPSDGGAAYITKDINDSAIENHKRTLRRDILEIAGVPDLTDERFSGNLSGIAIQYKLWGVDQLFAKKSRLMDKGLFRRARLIADALYATRNIYIPDVAKGMAVEFKPNIPSDAAADIDNAVKLREIVSEETLLEMVASATGVSTADEEERRARAGIRNVQ